MSEIVLDTISNDMEQMKLDYAFLEHAPTTTYPYFTGEYQEVPSGDESGEQETVFILTGFARGTDAKLALEEAKKKIKAYYPRVGGRLVSVEDSTLAIFYSDSFFIPSGDGELKKIQINLTIKEWSVN